MIEWYSALWIWSAGVLFAVSHSLLASQRCKQWVYRHGLQEPQYRLWYSLLAMLATIGWIVFIHGLPDVGLYQSSGVVRLVMLAVQLLGLVIVLAAFQPIDGLVFLGLRAAKEGGEAFVERGIYRRLRHPMYAGTILILLAMPEQSWNGLHFSLAIVVYFIVGSRYEEARMLVMHSEYKGYCKRVAAFVPGLY